MTLAGTEDLREVLAILGRGCPTKTCKECAFHVTDDDEACPRALVRGVLSLTKGAVEARQ